ncbi:hypothetical protein BDW74DRAFT_186558 [Aspergillus multicolor]|uniref:putative allergen Asp F4-like n=1 Tax=Aspergillus multicolor TaxID=41759 RepID=UPI003CCCD7D9
MKWESLILTALAAGSASAKPHALHGHRALHNHQKKDNGVNTKTVVQWDVVTVYTTITLDAGTTATATVADVDASTSTSLTSSTASAGIIEDLVLDASLSASLNEDFVAETTSTSTSTTTSTITSTTVSASSSTTTSTSSSTSTASSDSSSSSSDWSSTPSSGTYSTTGFGTRTNSSGSGVSYTGNVGSPWGSNIIEVDSSDASSYKYVLQITLPSNSSSSESWFVSFWNKIGPDGEMTGWYGHSALNFTLSPGESRYVAIDEDSQGGWGAAAGDSLPTDQYGGYACTWGEFDFGSTVNDGWSGWDVSAIQAQNADLTVQGMSICTAAGEDCSYITSGAGSVVNAYTAAEASVDGIGGSVASGAVRLAVEVDYSE